MEIRVLREDPIDTIAQMFTNLNTKILPLTDGELIKAHGWQANIPIIEFAKNLIGEPWVTKIEEDEIIDDVRENWYQTFPGGGPDGTKRETKRCDNIKGMIGYILSSIYSNSRLFDKRFAKIKNYLTPENVITDEQKDKFINDCSLFTSTINAIENSDKYFKRKCGMPKQISVFPIWGTIVTGRMTNQFNLKVIKFYNAIQKDEDLAEIYKNTLSGGGDGHATKSKLENVINLINSTMN